MGSIDYSYALEKRRQWLEWCVRNPSLVSDIKFAETLYRTNLSSGPTYLMNKKFCELVDTARRTLPEDLAFEKEWVLTKQGWLYLEEPFYTPTLDQNDWGFLAELNNVLKPSLPISAIGWIQLSDKVIDERNSKIIQGVLNEKGSPNRLLDHGATQFIVYADYGKATKLNRPGFGMWSYFILNPGDKVLDRLRVFEKNSMASNEAGKYIEDKETELTHEIRWIYTAFHLMSQRLTVIKNQQATRGTRRRFEKDKVPLQTDYKVVALRRMEEAREKAGALGEHKDWNWCWSVGGHWRNQFYPSEDVHRQIWIEEYVKGDLTKPFKPKTELIYKAVR